MKRDITSLSFRMVAAICLAGLIPLYTATLYFYLQAKDALHEAGKTRLQSVLGSRVQDMENTVNTAASDIMIASTNPVFLFQKEGKVGGVNWLEKEHDVLKALRKRLADKLDEACIIESGGAEVSRIVFDKIADKADLSSDESGASFFHHSFEVNPGDVYQGVPYISLDSRRWVFPTATPIANRDGKKLAVLHFEINFNYIKNVLASRADLGGGFAAIIDAEGHLLASTRGSSAGDMKSRDDLSDEQLETLKLPRFEMASAGLESLLKGVFGGKKMSAPADVEIGEESYLVLASPIQFQSRTENRWFVLAALPAGEIYATLGTWKYAAFTVVATLLLGIVAFLIGKGIARPIADLSRVSEAVASGNLDVNIPEIRRSDEIGALYGSFRAMVGSMKEMVSGMRKRAEEVEKLNASNQGVVHSLECVVTSVKMVTGDMASSSDKLSRVTQEMTSFTRSINEMAERVAGGMHQQSEEITQVSREVHNIVGAVESIASNASDQRQNVIATDRLVGSVADAVHRIAGNSREALSAAGISEEAAAAGDAAVRQTARGMEAVRSVVFDAAGVIRSLGEKSTHIGEIVQMIDEISDQTNLLALNAAIEAARAGEHGRGFAVVADEVRKLAERSAKATREISGLVSMIQSETTAAVKTIEKGTTAVEEGSVLSREAGAALNRISDAVRNVVEQINAVSESAERMTALVQETKEATSSILQVTESNIATTAQVTASGRSVLDHVTSVAAISEESAASSGEVSAAVGTQQHTIDELARQVGAMVSLTNRLRDTVDQCDLAGG